MKLRTTFENLTDDQIRHLYNTTMEGTANDAIVKYTCQIALGERCIRAGDELLKYRYPYKDEIAEAKLFVARALNRRAGIEEE